MNNSLLTTVSVALALLALAFTTYGVTVSLALAQQPDIQFTNTDPDHFVGTINGQPFESVTVLEDPRVMRYSGPSGEWYITDKGEIQADSLIQALSIYWTL